MHSQVPLIAHCYITPGQFLEVFISTYLFLLWNFYCYFQKNVSPSIEMEKTNEDSRDETVTHVHSVVSLEKFEEARIPCKILYSYFLSMCVYVYTCVCRPEVNLRFSSSEPYPQCFFRQGLSLAKNLPRQVACLSACLWLFSTGIIRVLNSEDELRSSCLQVMSFTDWATVPAKILNCLGVSPDTICWAHTGTSNPFS